MGFSNKLNPAQIQKVFDAFKLDWRDKKVNPEGWVKVKHDFFYGGLGINIYHGGFVDYHARMMKKGYNAEYAGKPETGDLILLVKIIADDPEIITGESDRKVIGLIKKILKIPINRPHPDLPEGVYMANSYLKQDDKYFARLPNKLLESALTASSKVVWAAIFSRVGKDQLYSFPGLNRIAEDTNLSKRTVQNAISELKKAGFLYENDRPGKSPHRYPTVNEYFNKVTEKFTMANIATHHSKSFRGTLENSTTELYLYKLNSNKKNQKLSIKNGFTPFLDRDYFSFFLLTFKKSVAEYHQCLEREVSAINLIAYEF